MGSKKVNQKIAEGNLVFYRCFVNTTTTLNHEEHSRLVRNPEFACKAVHYCTHATTHLYRKSHSRWMHKNTTVPVATHGLSRSAELSVQLLSQNDGVGMAQGGAHGCWRCNVGVCVFHRPFSL